MAKSIGVRDLKQGLIVKVEFGNGDMLRGCFYGKKMYHAGRMGTSSGSSTGNFLVIIDPVSKQPKVVDINGYQKKYKTTVKDITGTRFPKEVSEYLKKYVKALTKQQEKLVMEITMQEQRIQEDKVLYELEEVGKTLNYTEDADTVPFEKRVQLVFSTFNKVIKVNSNVNYVDTVRVYVDERSPNSEKGEIQLDINFKSLLNMGNEELGIIPFHEYDGSYQPDIDNSVDVNKVALTRLLVSNTDIQNLIKGINGIKGVSLKDNRLFVVDAGEYTGRALLEFSPEMEVDTKIKETDLRKLRSLLEGFVVSARARRKSQGGFRW